MTSSRAGYIEWLQARVDLGYQLRVYLQRVMTCRLRCTDRLRSYWATKTLPNTGKPQWETTLCTSTQKRIILLLLWWISCSNYIVDESHFNPKLTLSHQAILIWDVFVCFLVASCDLLCNFSFRISNHSTSYGYFIENCLVLLYLSLESFSSFISLFLFTFSHNIDRMVMFRVAFKALCIINGILIN